MPLTVENVAYHLRYDLDNVIRDDLQMLLDSAEQAVKDHVLAKYDAENKIQQRAILMMCGYFDENRGVDKNTPANDGFLPQSVKDLLTPYYVPLCI